MQTTLRNLESHLKEIHQAGAKAICVGGDHSIILAELRATYKQWGDLILVQFDAHTDTADQAWGEQFHHGTPIRRAIEEGLIKGENIYQIGIRVPHLTRSGRLCGSEKINVLDIDSFMT